MYKRPRGAQTQTHRRDCKVHRRQRQRAQQTGAMRVRRRGMTRRGGARRGAWVAGAPDLQWSANWCASFRRASLSTFATGPYAKLLMPLIVELSCAGAQHAGAPKQRRRGHESAGQGARRVMAVRGAAALGRLARRGHQPHGAGPALIPRVR
jgi:hypothetical protein